MHHLISHSSHANKNKNKEQHSITFRYGDLAGAAAMPDGLAVLGIFFRMADEDNPALGPVMEAARRIKESDLIGLLTKWRKKGGTFM